jgi:hypothetical protein
MSIIPGQFPNPITIAPSTANTQRIKPNRRNKPTKNHVIRNMNHIHSNNSPTKTPTHIIK